MWPGNHLVPRVAEPAGSCIPTHAHWCPPDPNCLPYPSGPSPPPPPSTTPALPQPITWFYYTTWSVMADLWATLLSTALEARVCVTYFQLCKVRSFYVISRRFYLNKHCELKQCSLHVRHGTDQTIIDNAIDEQCKHLRTCIRAKDGHPEQTLTCSLTGLLTLYIYIADL